MTAPVKAPAAATRPVRKGQIATPEAVAQACDEMFRAGEKITEASVRARIGGGGPGVILQNIRAWEATLRERFLSMEGSLAEYDAGDRPPGVPEALWTALKPVWDQLVREARAHAAKRLEDAHAALERDRQSLDEEADRVRDADARWQQDKQDTTARIDELNQAVALHKDRAAQLAGELIQAGHELTAKATQIEALQAALEQGREAARTAEAAHQADLQRWAQQIDAARQDAKAKVSAAEGRARSLEDQLASAQASLADLRISHERTRVELEAAQSADRRSQAEIERLRGERAVPAKRSPAPRKPSTKKPAR